MNTEERLARVELQLRWHRRVGALALAVVAIVLLVSLGGEPEPQKLTVRSLEVRSERDKARVRLTPYHMAFFDEYGKRRIILGPGEAGSTLSFADKDGIGRITLGTLGDGWPVLSLMDKGLRSRVMLTVWESGGHLQFRDKADKVIWEAPGE